VKVQPHPPLLTSAADRSEWSSSRPNRFTPQERNPVPIAQEAGWTPEPVWNLWRWGREEKKNPVLGIEPRFLDRPFRSQLNQIHYTEYPKILCLCDFLIILCKLKAEVTRNRDEESPGKEPSAV